MEERLYYSVRAKTSKYYARVDFITRASQSPQESNETTTKSIKPTLTG